MGSEAARSNLAFGRLVIEVLRKSGVEHFVVSPGSRSTPLAVAAAECGAYSVHADERSAAFYALGRSKVTRVPVAFICTSGSALGHALPAVMEAYESGLPLMVLSADRPLELQHCHAGQTLDQVKVYGTYARFFAQLPLPACRVGLARQVRELCCRAVEASMAESCGPVHLNCPFREPFFCDSGEWLVPEEVLSGLSPVQPVRSVGNPIGQLPERTLLLAGARAGRENPAELGALLEFLRAGKVPVLADGCNPLRHLRDMGIPVIAHYDRLARNELRWASLAPEALLLWGEPPISKVLRQRLEAMDLPVHHFGSGKRGLNPFHGRYQWHGNDVAAVLSGLSPKSTAYAQQWAKADADAESGLQTYFAASHSFFEGDVHRSLIDELGVGTLVLYANSLSIRDAEWFVPTGKTDWEPFSQRGANGIDGTVSMARGIVEAAGRPGVLVIGDLALIHDSNGLLQAARTRPGLLIVMINNSGGGIFELLPAAKHVEQFESLYGTPQSVDFRCLAHAHGVQYKRAESRDELVSVLREYEPDGLTLLEVIIDRKASADCHRESLKLLISSRA